MEKSESLEARLGEMLAAGGLTIACAESCTGGLVTSRLTDVAGSSRYVMGSVVCYSNEIKKRAVGVSGKTLAQYGAVSEPVAREMAEGIRRFIGTDLGIGITGIAGPGGSVEGKPTGLVFISVAGASGTEAKEFHFQGNRMDIKRQSADQALELALAYTCKSK